ncbi:hypothetical protein RJT34_05095 [Clitoria ternatea]|uniref:Membrane-associated kinase regulator 1 n=1 Tax=Clitoria ternatea TaxID=43366 RepID=A0AAN9K2L0_CLITE
MGRRTGKLESKSYTLPPSPSHSSSSSDFEFTISISPRKSSTTLCPADELFYKGQLLPLHLSPRISMVRTLLLSSSSTTSSSTPRDSTASTSSSSFTSDLAIFPDCDSSRPSSVTEDDDLKHLHPHKKTTPPNNKYFSFSRKLSSVFRNKDTTTVVATNTTPKTRDPVKRMSTTAKEAIRKYLKKVKPLYEKLSQKTTTTNTPTTTSATTSLSLLTKTAKEEGGKRGRVKESGVGVGVGMLSHSFSGNLRYPRRRRSCVSSCPSSMRSSPSHSGVLSHYGGGDTSSMEELHSAIQGAIAHCKNSLVHKQNNG